MKKIFLCFICFLVGCSTSVKNSFWNFIVADTENDDQIKTVQKFNEQLFVAGLNTSNDVGQLTNYSPFIHIKNEGESDWKHELHFDFNQVDQILSNKNLLLAVGTRFTINSFESSRRIVYSYKNNRWSKISLPVDDFEKIWIIDESNIIIRKNYNEYFKTINGSDWNHYSPLNDALAFQEIGIAKNQMWGVNLDRGKKTLSGFVLDSFHKTSDIPLSPTQTIKGVQEKNNKLFFLSEEGRKAKLLSLEVSQEKFETKDSLNLDDEEYVNNFFMGDDLVLVICGKQKGSFTEYYLYFKNGSNAIWKKQAFPDLTYSIFSFANNTLLGVFEKNKVFYKKF